MRVFDILNNFKEVDKNVDLTKSNYWILVAVEELENIKDLLLLDEEIIYECIDLQQLPKISFFDGYVFIVFNILEYKDKEVISKELNIILSEDYIITVCKEDLSIIEELIEDIKDSKNCFILKEKPIPCILLYYILDRIIVRNYDVISSLEAQADKIEISILKNPKQVQIDELIHLRRQVYKIRKFLNPLRYIGDSLISNDNSIIKQDSLKFFKNLNNKLDKLMMALESLIQNLALVREAFESEIANKTNDLMKVFTIIATIFLPLNLITSMYGMNVKHIPLVGIDYGYYYIVLIMILVSIFMIFLFKKKKWL
ncbi:magnesium transporter CorA family protein [Clostridium omnivorum]|uniref:Dihydroorotate dehydrogenase n=1 Tax=Clostridium omnivorum TaxID=1604902 RepID=A0ABQ5NAQ2_9CLOT|nr:magnesium transporter CorA family protein [Clostridium sp. E14]GLC32152.1 dihydroorotate dehydrogenase [Clostridium sp. E14]